MLCGCGASGSAATDDAAARPGPQGADPAPLSLIPTDLAPYTETIGGTTVQFEMIPVPGAPGQPAFWMSATEIPWDVYDIYVYKLDETGPPRPPSEDATSRPSKPYAIPGEDFGHQGIPALAMTEKGAREFMNWLSDKTGHPYRLPTEAEWEHACRAGLVGLEGIPTDDYVWHAGNADEQAHLVDSKRPNALGIYHMVGNIAEWVVADDGAHVVKGGTYREPASALDCTVREAYQPAWQETDPQLPKSTWWLSDAPFLGLRVVRAAPSMSSN